MKYRSSISDEEFSINFSASAILKVEKLADSSFRIVGVLFGSSENCIVGSQNEHIEAQIMRKLKQKVLLNVIFYGKYQWFNIYLQLGILI